MMEGKSPPTASPPPRAGDTEVSSHKTSLGLGEAREGNKTAPEGNTSAADGLGGAAPTETGNGGPGLSSPQPNTAPETQMAPGSDEKPPAKAGGVHIPIVTSANPEAPNTMVDALQSASILEEHRTLMGTVAERIQSAKSSLNEAFSSLLTGFEVHNVMMLVIFLRKVCLCIHSSS